MCYTIRSSGVYTSDVYRRNCTTFYITLELSLYYDGVCRYYYYLNYIEIYRRDNRITLSKHYKDRNANTVVITFNKYILL